MRAIPPVQLVSCNEYAFVEAINFYIPKRVFSGYIMMRELLDFSFVQP
jgi:hypothetical protein